MTRQSLSPHSTDLAALAGELRVAVSKLVRRAREHSQSSDFTSAQKSVLFHLERDGPATVSALARAQRVKPQSMRITVAGLETLGAVKGEADPTDGRQTLIDLTPTFRRTLQASRAAKEDWLIRALQAQLSAREQVRLAAAVGLLQRLADS
ncbi:MarR family transcriptional regulator [Paraburkholderia sp. CNPSo 3155]|uniref:MarR family winged helix-turn-helix transcriptional regulator n=1 Tax=Paraburkholderia atlantica TaxID=2654982 RepID=UPI00128AE0FD|nr:MarR family transcriptional regulator [Paraburkholderia atlantica]MPW07812.1 MarR family transcriptional regulator [Paraburkholderia atlantica]